ncbi:MAG: fibronectin type III domain-containing protein, partial [bacterium]|nr:fibronectin type III domain-containing protein [bacterium]
EIYIGGASTPEQTYTAGAGSYTFTHTGLTPNTSYIYSILSRNAAGTAFDTASLTTGACSLATLTVNAVRGLTDIVVPITSDNGNAFGGTTNYTKTSASNISATLTAPATSGTATFLRFDGCASTSGTSCTVPVAVGSGKTVTAVYQTPSTPTLTLEISKDSSTWKTSELFSYTDLGYLRYSGSSIKNCTASASPAISSWSGAVTPGSAQTVKQVYPLPTGNPQTFSVSCLSTVDNSVVATSVTANVKPEAPNATGAATSCSTGTVTWTDSALATSYEIYIGGASTPEQTYTAGAGSYTFTHTGLTPNTSYIYSILSRNAAGTAFDTASLSTPLVCSLSNSATLNVTATRGTSSITVPVTSDSTNLFGGNTPYTQTQTGMINTVLTAPATSGSATFLRFDGCDTTNTSLRNCTISIPLGLESTVTAVYATPPPPPPDMVADCFVSPKRAYINDAILWQANVQGGVAPYTYVWKRDVTGTLSNTNQTTYQLFTSYSTVGDRYGTIEVTDSQTKKVTVDCQNNPLTIELPPDPDFALIPDPTVFVLKSQAGCADSTKVTISVLDVNFSDDVSLSAKPARVGTVDLTYSFTVPGSGTTDTTLSSSEYSRGSDLTVSACSAIPSGTMVTVTGESGSGVSKKTRTVTIPIRTSDINPEFEEF